MTQYELEFVTSQAADTIHYRGNPTGFEAGDTPLLFLYASPGALNPPEVVDWWAERAKNIETVYIGAGLHFAQEDQPYAIGRAISDWYRRLN